MVAGGKPDMFDAKPDDGKEADVSPWIPPPGRQSDPASGSELMAEGREVGLPLEDTSCKHTKQPPELEATLSILSTDCPLSSIASGLSEQPGQDDPSSCPKLTAHGAQVDIPLGDTSSKNAKDLTELEATFSVLSLVFNFGLYTIPLAFRDSGHMASFFVFASASIFIICAYLIGAVLQELRDSGETRPDYGDMARRLGGSKLEVLMSMSANFEISVYAWGNLIIYGSSMEQFFPAVSKGAAIWVCSALALLMCAIPDKAYSYVYFVAAAGIVTACCVVLVSGFELPQWAEATTVAGPIANFPSSMSLVVFAGAAHPMLPAVFQNTSKKTFDRASRNAWLLWALFATIFGCGCYYMFGDTIRPVALENIGLDLHGETLSSASGFVAFASAWVVVRHQFAMVSFARPLASRLARAVGLELPEGNGGWRSVAAAAPVMIFYASGAYFLRDALHTLETVAGGTLMSFTCYLFPGLAYIAICKNKTFVWWAAAVGAVSWGAFVTASLALKLVQWLVGEGQ